MNTNIKPPTNNHPRVLAKISSVAAGSTPDGTDTWVFTFTTDAGRIFQKTVIKGTFSEAVLSNLHMGENPEWHKIAFVRPGLLVQLVLDEGGTKCMYVNEVDQATRRVIFKQRAPKPVLKPLDPADKGFWDDMPKAPPGAILASKEPTILPTDTPIEEADKHFPDYEIAQDFAHLSKLDQEFIRNLMKRFMGVR